MSISNEVQFRCSNAAGRTSKRRVGWFGFLSESSTAGLAAPTPTVAFRRQSARVAPERCFTDGNPAQDGPYATGAPRRCTSRAERRALPPSKGAAPGLQRRQGRSDERQMRVTHDDRHTVELWWACLLVAARHVRLCAASAVTLAPVHVLPVTSVR